MTADPPPGVTILPAPAELQLGDDNDEYFYGWRGYQGDRSALTAVEAARSFPQPSAVDPPEALRSAKLFACSGSLDSGRYREATRYRIMPEMGWEEARIALRRLFVPVRFGDGTPSDYVALAEFALTASGFQGFVGRRGDHAVKLRGGLVDAIERLHSKLEALIQKADHNAVRLARPIPQHGEEISDQGSVYRIQHSILGAFWTAVPIAADQWERIAKATPDQVIAALACMRTTLAIWNARRPVAESIRQRLKDPATLPTANDYAEALHIADMLVFTSEKLLALYAGIVYSMPIYRLYPATSEKEAIALWWPWGRPAPLMAGDPPRRPKPRKQVLDPSLITATRPQDVVREIMEKTGINRTTVQHMTAPLRQKMRQQRQSEARKLLAQGVSKAEVARRVGLSPSRISALFKGKQHSSEDELLLDLLRRRSSPIG